ncbi:peroxiredoxin-like family protein [uncultured Clostridium sp.]|uniref:peroxiredoxin-like family protein n=1 Tax=uncultured Clostridium sp. TaxID=59620 RepID=UPI00262B448E|nr:peroxiredoxin-like family protein [uncultured Clostridium sp.]
MSLTKKLEILASQSKEKMPEETLKTFMAFTQELKNSDIEKNALKIGDKAPKFSLKNAYGKVISSDELLKDGPLVINFYRGKWCPYCNLELQEYAARVNEIKALGANFVAISPELPDNEVSSDIAFEILSDTENRLAKLFKIAFELNTEVKELYTKFGFDLTVKNGYDKFELPVPATYIIDKDYNIKLSFVNVDYTKRLDINDVIKELENLKK